MIMSVIFPGGQHTSSTWMAELHDALINQYVQAAAEIYFFFSSFTKASGRGFKSLPRDLAPLSVPWHLNAIWGLLAARLQCSHSQRLVTKKKRIY